MQRHAETPTNVLRLRQFAVDLFLAEPILRALGALRRPASPSIAVALPPTSTWQTLLKAHQTLILDDAQGVAVESLGGALWITQEHDTEDHVLGAGESFRIRRNGTTIVYTAKGASVRIARAAGSAR